MFTTIMNEIYFQPITSQEIIEIVEIIESRFFLK